jgi:predicted transposase/invertase (TIGR01784 family)
MRAKYVNPFTDFGFKKIFGEEASKPLLMDFLNALLPEENKIRHLSFKDKEQQGDIEVDRKVIYDIYCESEKGEKFIVELQKAKQNYFIERTVYYSTFPIREQAEKGKWNFNLKAVFCIGILDFTFNDYETEPEKKEVVHTIMLKDQNGKTFYYKLTYIYLEMPNFNKKVEDLETRLDQWLYFIKHLEDFQSIPEIFKDAIFQQALDKAEIAKFGPAEMDNYEVSLKVFRDNINTFEYAKETAYSDGKMYEKTESAKRMRLKGFSIKDISEITGLTDEEINKL